MALLYPSLEEARAMTADELQHAICYPSPERQEAFRLAPELSETHLQRLNEILDDKLDAEQEEALKRARQAS